MFPKTLRFPSQSISAVGLRTSVSGLLCQFVPVAAIFTVSLLVMMPSTCAQIAQNRGNIRNLFRIEQNDQSGFIDSTGKIAIKPKFDSAHDFSEGLAAVRVKDKWGFINEEGVVVIKPKFHRVGDFVDGLAYAHIEHSHIIGFPDYERGFITRNGNFLFHFNFMEHGDKFSDGLVSVRATDKWGYMDRSGKIVIEPKWDYVSEFSDGIAVVNIRNTGNFLMDKHGLIDKTGTYVVEPQSESSFADFFEGYAKTTGGLFGRVGFVDTHGKEAFSLSVVTDATRFSEGLASLKHRGGWWAVINKKGEYLFYLDDVKDVSYSSDGMIRVKVDDEYGYITNAGKIAIEPQFDTAENFVGGLARTTLGSMTAYVDKSGKYVWQSAPSPLRCSRVEKAPPPLSLPPNLLDLSPVEMAKNLTPVVEKLRGLTFKHAVSIVQTTADEYNQLLRESLAPELADPADWKSKQFFLTHIGMMNADQEQINRSIDHFIRTHPTFYDIRKDRIVISGEKVSGFLLNLSLVASLTKALDSQNFQKFTDSLVQSSGNWDRSFALRAVSEGSASLIASSYLMRLQITPPAEGGTDIKVVPSQSESATDPYYVLSYLFEQAVRPSLAGQWFLSRGRERELFKPCPSDIDSVFLNPPERSEQILIPERYWYPELDKGYVLTKSMTFPGSIEPLGKAWKKQSTIPLGQAFLSSLYKSIWKDQLHNVNTRTNEGKELSELYNGLDTLSKQWAGDNLVTYSNAEGTIYVWVTSWQSGVFIHYEKKFDELLTKMIAAKAERGITPRLAKASASDKMVVVVGDLPDASLSAVASYMLKNVRVGK